MSIWQYLNKRVMKVDFSTHLIIYIGLNVRFKMLLISIPIVFACGASSFIFICFVEYNVCVCLLPTLTKGSYVKKTNQHDVNEITFA